MGMIIMITLVEMIRIALSRHRRRIDGIATFFFRPVETGVEVSLSLFHILFGRCERGRRDPRALVVTTMTTTALVARGGGGIDR